MWVAMSQRWLTRPENWAENEVDRRLSMSVKPEGSTFARGPLFFHPAQRPGCYFFMAMLSSGNGRLNSRCRRVEASTQPMTALVAANQPRLPGI